MDGLLLGAAALLAGLLHGRWVLRWGGYLAAGTALWGAYRLPMAFRLAPRPTVPRRRAASSAATSHG